jgi:hypothetical protein
VDEAFRPEVVRGQLDPKGRITVTNFRGLPRPGELTTEFTELARRAREEAEAPMSSDEIPRRYREGIRDWFDTLDRR